MLTEPHPPVAYLLSFDAEEEKEMYDSNQKKN